MLGTLSRRGRIYDDKYEALEEVGRGSFGVVWRGRDNRLARDVAIKLLERSSTSERAPTRFLREARILASLEHPNIVPVYSFGEQDGELFFVMKFVEGSDLSWHRHARERTPAAVTALLAPVADALDYAHGRQVVHRDLKPANIRITPEGRPVLIDFGIAQAAGLGRLTRPNTMLGSPHYMSPEQTSGQTAGAASDQYTFAVILYEMLTGRRPFEGETPMAVLYEHVNTTPPPPTRFNPDLSGETEEAVLRGLSKEPDDRYPSCTELLLATGLLPSIESTISATAVRAVQTDDLEKSDELRVRLLVVEDELTDYLIVERQLQGAEAGNFTCRNVTRLGDLFLALREPTDAILLDLGLPDSQGIVTLKRAREMAGELPIVIQTASDDDGLARQALQAGAQDYVVKGHTHGRALARALQFAVARHRIIGGDGSEALRCGVTGLPNRVLFEDRLRVELARAARDDEAFGIARLSLGSVAPPRLGRVADALRAALLPWETAAHLGDRELVLLLPADGGGVDGRLSEVLEAIRGALSDAPAVRSARLVGREDVQGALDAVGLS